MQISSKHRSHFLEFVQVESLFDIRSSTLYPLPLYTLDLHFTVDKVQRYPTHLLAESGKFSSLTKP